MVGIQCEVASLVHCLCPISALVLWAASQEGHLPPHKTKHTNKTTHITCIHTHTHKKSHNIEKQQKKLGAIFADVSDSYQVCHILPRLVIWYSSPFFLLFSPVPSPPQVCAKTMEKLVAGEDVTEEDLILLGQLEVSLFYNSQYIAIL